MFSLLFVKLEYIHMMTECPRWLRRQSWLSFIDAGTNPDQIFIFLWFHIVLLQIILVWRWEFFSSLNSWKSSSRLYQQKFGSCLNSSWQCYVNFFGYLFKLKTLVSSRTEMFSCNESKRNKISFCSKGQKTKLLQIQWWENQSCLGIRIPETRDRKGSKIKG